MANGSKQAERPQKYGVCTSNRIVKVTKQIDAFSLTGRREALKNRARAFRGLVLDWAVPQDLRDLFRVGA